MQQDDFAVVITQLLGRVSSGDLLVLCAGDPYGNSTRWVFDVEHDTARARNFEFQLRSWNGKNIFAPIVSFSLTPLSPGCWNARPFIEQPKLPNVSIAVDASAGKIKYRVALDLVHSTSR
jgi:hypothetical protein